MDNNAWLWRKKSSEKTIVADKADISLNRIDEEVQKLPTKKAVGPERSVKNLNEKLASVLLDYHPQDDLVRKHAKVAQEASAGLEKSEAETGFMKKELDETWKHGLAADEKLACSNTALMKCKQQLNFVQLEPEKRIHDSVMKTSDEFEKIRKELERNLAEANKSLAKLAAENSHLSKALLLKEKQIEDLHKSKCETEAEFNTLMARLDATEKENAFLKYEFRILEKELEIRNDEMEYMRRSVDAEHKQRLEDVKKITKLEAECQRLRLLVRKKLPGPAALEKMKGEFKMGRDQMEMKRRNLNPSRDLIVREAIMECSPEIFSKNSLLIERLHDIEEENKILKGTVNMKSTELQASRMMYSRTASRLSHVETQLKELCKGQKPMELTICGPVSSEISIMPVDNASDDGISSSGSWANALILELEHFKAGKLKHQLEHKPIDVSDMSLMDDFVEMEKLAIVSTETASVGRCQPDVTGKELVPVVQNHFSPTMTKPEIHSTDIATENSFDWLQVVLNAMLKQKHISKQSLDELLEDIRIALGFIKHPTVSEADSVAISRNHGGLKALEISSDIPSKSPNISPSSHSLDADSGIDTLIKERSSQHLESNLIKSIRKIIELIEEISRLSSVDFNASDSFSERDRSSLTLVTPVPYTVHVFQWHSSELNALLQKLVHTCNDLLNGKSDLEKVVGEFSFALDWIINNSVAPKDAPTTRSKIKKHFGWSEPEVENEVGAAVDGLLSTSNRVHKSEEQSSCLVSASPLHDQNVSFQTECIQGNIQEENKRLKDELRNIETRLESVTDKSQALMIQLRESENNIGALKEEVKTLKESKEMIEDQMENQKSLNEDLDTQLTVAKAKLNEVFQKFSSLEVELEYKNNCCEELEATCLELQLQLESVAKKEAPNCGTNQEGKQSQNGWEITAASVKLAECQETILHLGKQLKALASPQEAVLFDKVFSSTNPATTTAINKKLTKRFSLRDQMIAEDCAKAEVFKSLHKKGTLSMEDAPKPSLLLSKDCNLYDPNALVHTPEAYHNSKNKASSTAAGSRAIVPSKKRGVGLLMKLLLRRKNGSSKKSKSLAMV